MHLSRHSIPSPIRSGSQAARSAFTITELLVVIGIIVVLVGILLPALAAVRGKAMETATTGTMNELSKACDIYYGDHGVYPGVLPDEILIGLTERITGTENVLLALMGGYRLVTPYTVPDSAEAEEYDAFSGNQIVDPGANDGWGLKVDVAQLGQGPLVNMKPYSPYFSPSGSEVRRTKGQESVEPADDVLQLPDLMDRWGQPILYFRASRNTGPIAADPSNPSALPQFITGVNDPYIESDGLGDARENQAELSLFHPSQHAASGTDANATFAQIVRAPAQGAPDEPLYSTPRGRYAIMSAGADGVYFSEEDGPGTSADPVFNIVDDTDFGTPDVIKEYDDIVIMGGG